MLGLNRASYYHEPATETIENLRLMRRIDEQYLKTPFFGSRRMAVVLSNEGEEVTASVYQTCCRERIWVRKSVLSMQDIIFPRRLSFSG